MTDNPRQPELPKPAPPEVSDAGALKRVQDKVAGAAGAVAGAVGGVAGGVRDRAVEAAGAVKDKAVDAAGAMKDKAVDAAGAVKEHGAKQAEKVARVAAAAGMVVLPMTMNEAKIDAALLKKTDPTEHAEKIEKKAQLAEGLQIGMEEIGTKNKAKEEEAEAANREQRRHPPG
jgi:hypothetical protein